MKAIFTLATLVLAVAAVPDGLTSSSDSLAANASGPPKDLTPIKLSPMTTDSASFTSYACAVVSKSDPYNHQAVGYGGSEASVLSATKKACKKSDCTRYICVPRGCVALTYATNGKGIGMGGAHGYGSGDLKKAESNALSACKKYGTCKVNGYACSQGYD